MSRASPFLAVLLFATPLAAQTADEPWRDSFYPVVSYTGNDGVSIGMRFAWNKRGPWQAPYFNAGSFLADASYSASGSYLVSTILRAPGLKKGWRLWASASAAKQTRFEYFGLGEATVYHPDSITDAQRYFYKVRRSQLQARADLSRNLVGRVWVTGMLQYKQVEFTDLPGRSIFTDDFTSPLSETDAITGIGLVYDSRDNDYDTHKGALVAARILRGTAGDGYDRWVVEGRGWVPFGEWSSTWLSARAVASQAEGDVPLDARMYLPVWEGQVRTFGGVESHRGTLDQRYLGRGLLFGNLSVQHDFINAGGLGAVGVLAFIDAGRVFETDDFSLGTEGMKVGGGVGAYFRLMQTGVYTFNFAQGPDGFVFTLGNSWMF